MQGREQILYIFTDGDFFGESHLFNDYRAPYSIEALDEVMICTLNKQHFQQFLLVNPQVSIKIIEELSRRISLMETNLQSMGVRSVDARIAALILEYDEKFSRLSNQGKLIQLPLSREGIANSLGIARETLSRKLASFEQQGKLQALGNKSLIILDKEFFQKLAGL